MGALTGKNYPFEVRGWDIEKFDSIDPTDGFASSTKVFVRNNQILLIEPSTNISTFNWITDKGRQFFDGLEKQNSTFYINNNKSWDFSLKDLTQNIYFLEHCNKQDLKPYFFLITFGNNISIEILNLLLIFMKKFSFFKLRKHENQKINNDLESSFQLSLRSHHNDNLNNSELCLLINTNTRNEGSHLNLKLRQKIFKGNFKLLTIGSLINFTFPVTFLGSNLNLFQTILEGNDLSCQDFKHSKNPIIITNNQTLKKNSISNLIDNSNNLSYQTIINKHSEINILNPYLNGVGIYVTYQFLPLSKEDILNASALYFIYYNNIFDNNSRISIQIKKKINLLIIKSRASFFENNETFINTKGVLKRTKKIIYKKKNKNQWQILRKFFKHCNTNLKFLIQKNNDNIFFNSKKVTEFRNYHNFQYYAIRSLNNLNFYLTQKNQTFKLSYSTNSKFKNPRKKISSTKLVYWLNDFYTGIKDGLSENSKVLTKCSRIFKNSASTFF